MNSKSISQSNAAQSDAPSRAFQNLIYWLSLAALFVAAMFVRHIVAANTDVSWLLTEGDRLLDGQRLYADIIEVNPPMAILAYIPGSVIARALHVPAEIVVDGLIFLAIAVSLCMSAKILNVASMFERLRSWPFALIAVAVLTILPTQAFGQREHLALIALLPALAVYVRRATNDTPPLWAIIAAGLGAGVTLTFKPHFAIAILCGVSALAVYGRSWRIFFGIENFIAAAVAGAYAIFTLMFFPDFFTAMGPLARDVYMPVGLSLIALLSKAAAFIWIALMAAAWVLKRRTAIDASFILLFATSFGFAVVFCLQRKGWAYHSYPMIALAMLALGYALVAHRFTQTFDRVLGAVATALFAVLFVGSMIWFDNAFDAKPLEARIAKLGSNPKILAITAEPGIGHPLTRALGGTFVSRQPSLWIAAYVDRLKQDGPLDPAHEAILENYAARERAMLIEDIRKNPPTVVLIDNLTGDWSAWLRNHPDVATLLKPYQHVETLNSVEILKRAN